MRPRLCTSRVLRVEWYQLQPIQVSHVCTDWCSYYRYPCYHYISVFGIFLQVLLLFICRKVSSRFSKARYEESRGDLYLFGVWSRGIKVQVLVCRMSAWNMIWRTLKSVFKYHHSWGVYYCFMSQRYTKAVLSERSMSEEWLKEHHSLWQQKKKQKKTIQHNSEVRKLKNQSDEGSWWGEKHLIPPCSLKAI